MLHSFVRDPLYHGSPTESAGGVRQNTRLANANSPNWTRAGATDRLREVDGIGPVRAARILAAWAEQKAKLWSSCIGTARAVRIFKTYGSGAVQVMTENPYRLARDIRGIGFKTADAIAMKLGIEKTATIRVRAGIPCALTEAMTRGTAVCRRKG